MGDQADLCICGKSLGIHSLGIGRGGVEVEWCAVSVSWRFAKSKKEIMTGMYIPLLSTYFTSLHKSGIQFEVIRYL